MVGASCLIAKKSEQNKNEWNKNWLGPSDFGWWGPPLPSLSVNKSELNKNEQNKNEQNKSCVTQQNKHQQNKNCLEPLDFGYWGPPILSTKRSEWNKNERTKIV